MELIRLRLQNFRQFRDESIEFARGDKKNVTVVHGSNGAGKTTLLNAFTWLFYGEVSFDTRPDRLVNEGVIADASLEDKISVVVGLKFNHENKTYLAKRESTYQKQTDDDLDGVRVDHDVTLDRKSGANWSPVNNPQDMLTQIVPERLSELFFFDGEDIDNLAGIDNQDQIRKAIENIMGLTILERAVKHLGDAAKRFEKEAGDLGSDEYEQLIEDKNEIKEEAEELERKKVDKINAKDQLEREIDDIKMKLRSRPGTAELQREREELEEDLKEEKSEINQLTKELADIVGERGFASVAVPLIRETAEDLNELRKEGVIPSELSDSYLDDLLNAEMCLCGRSLSDDVEHREYRNIVEELKGDGVADGVEGSALRIIHDIDRFTEYQQSVSKNMETKMEERSKSRTNKEKLEEKISEVGRKLESEGESARELEDTLENKNDERDNKIREIQDIENKIKTKKSRIENKKEEISKKEDERQETKLAKRRQEGAKRVQSTLENSFDQLKDTVRKMSNKRVNEKFGQIATKDLTAKINQDFELKITQTVGNDEVEVDKSTGERQIASLAFIGSLVSIARDRYEQDTDSDYFEGGIYPLVMDSPFGALDKSHRRQISKVIPTLANQVIVFATDSQWEGPVEQEMSRRAAQQYWLNFEPGDGSTTYPKTQLQAEKLTAGGD